MLTFETMGILGVTVRVGSTDAVTTLPQTLLHNRERMAIAAMLAIEDASIRVAFNIDPTQGVEGLGYLLSPGDSWRIVGQGNLRNLRYINAASGMNAVLIITPEYSY